MFWLLGREACGILLAPWPGIEPEPAALKKKVLTSGLSEKSLNLPHFLTLFVFRFNFHFIKIIFSNYLLSFRLFDGSIIPT